MSRSKQCSRASIESEIGKIPGDWSIAKLSDIAQVIVSNVDKKINENETYIYLCNYMDVYQNENITNKMNFMLGSASEMEINKFSLNYGDVLLTKDSETAQDIASSAVVTETISNLICGYHLAILRPKKEHIDSFYLAKTLQHKRVHNQFVSRANGVTRFGLTLSVINNVTIPVPPLIEQYEIAKILSTWDRAIEQVQRLIEAKQRQKKGLIQALIAGKLRFPEYGPPIRQKGDLPTGWRLIKIGQLVKRVRKPVNVNPEQFYSEIGIRSHGKGIFHKEVCLGKSLGNKSVFKVEPDVFILNIVFAWEQAIAKTTYREEGMVASHRFPMYRPLEMLIDLEYLCLYFLTPQGKSLLGLVSPGGAGRNKTLNQNAFLNLVIPIPPVKEQMRISSILVDFEKEIGILYQYYNTLTSQKKGLMQKLLTGEIRVKVD